MTIKSFLLKILFFFSLLLVFFAIGTALPATPCAKTSLLFAKPAKDSLLQHVPSPRLILVGGSNVSMSVDSQTLKDSLHLNPVNTGIHAAIGLVFMLDHTLPYVKKGDVVVVIPEYDQLFGDFAYGSQEMMRTVLDVRTTDWHTVRWKQIENAYEFLPAYAISKFAPTEYSTKGGDAVYLRDAFNGYGDSFRRLPNHEPNQLVFGEIDRPFNPDIIKEMQAFQKQVIAKGARMVLAFPAFEERSYDNNVSQVKLTEKAYRKGGFTVVGNPQKYRFPNTLMYDTPYHLSHEGVKIRTQMLVRELIDEAKIKRHG